MARDIDPFKVSSPRIFLVRMLVFLILCGLIVVVIHPQILVAFKANPPLNALIIGVLVIGIILAFRQVIRLFPEVAWVNGFRLADPGIAVERSPGAAGADGEIRATASAACRCQPRPCAASSTLDRHPARRSARHVALYDRTAHLPRTARYVLGIDRHRRLGWRRDQQFEGRRTPTRRSIRCETGSPLRSAAWHLVSSSLFGLAGSLVPASPTCR